MQVRQGKITEEAAAEHVENAQKDSAGFATVEESDIGKKGPQRQWADKEIIAQVTYLCFINEKSIQLNIIFFAVLPLLPGGIRHNLNDVNFFDI